MIKLIKLVFSYGSLIFAVGFLWPLFAQIIEAISWVPPFGLSALEAAIFPALMLGVIAQMRGTWLWQP